MQIPARNCTGGYEKRASSSFKYESNPTGFAVPVRYEKERILSALIGEPFGLMAVGGVMIAVAVMGPRAVPGVRRAVIVGLRIIDVRPQIIPVGVIIKVPRIAIVTARESEAESFNSASDEHLRVRALRREQCQSTYRHCH
jgi:hypothetical protein